jgi:hypothetical protein
VLFYHLAHLLATYSQFRFNMPLKSKLFSAGTLHFVVDDCVLFFEGGVALIALRTDALRTFYFLNSSRMRSSHGDIVCELISDESEAALIIIVIIIC